ncbi:MAG: hypothetical protein H0U76_07935 [Ktedonobacteraceae bacterium]|nr:hypothetical protein [Ktedonobacteraceae bacterium]
MASQHSSLHSHSRSRSDYGQRRRGQEIIKRGIMTQFFPATYTANILIMEATSTVIQGVPVACHLDGTSAQLNTLCAVLFFDEQNYTDAVVLAVYPNGSQGVPVPAPGRIVFVNGYQQFSSQTINAGSASTFTLTGGSSGIPAGALGTLYKVFFSSPTAGSYIQLAPHGASDMSAYASVGNLPLANGTLNSTGTLQMDAAGRIDIKANNGNCTVTLYTHGYVF